METTSSSLDPEPTSPLCFFNTRSAALDHAWASRVFSMLQLMAEWDVDVVICCGSRYLAHLHDTAGESTAPRPFAWGALEHRYLQNLNGIHSYFHNIFAHA